jgi:glucose 1-dehydrogenase
MRRPFRRIICRNHAAMAAVDLKGEVAVVTGASLGIGEATAIALARSGASVVVNYRSHREQAEKVVAECEAAGGKAVAVQGDVADQSAVEALIAAAVKNFGKLTIAVSNAAYSDRELFYKADMAGFKRTVDVTMWGAFYLMRAATQQMIAQAGSSPGVPGGGSIVLVSSPHAFIPAPRAMAYNMSKAAIEHMAKTAAIEVAEHRIRINLIQPGWTDTPGERKFASEETLQTAGAKIPLGRLGTPQEMAEGILFLVDPKNTYVTGAALLIDGGISLPWWANRGSAAPG